MRARVAHVLAIALFAALPLIGDARWPGPSTGQSGAPGNNGAISGVVTDGTTRRPLPGAIVELSPSGRGAVPQTRQVTDEKGRFVFTNVPAPANYFVNATRLGYFDGGYGQIPGGTYAGTIALGSGAWFREADITLSRPGAIGGTVIDGQGNPVVGAFVRVLPEVVIAGVPQVASGPTTTTDDQGEYRLAGLTPGKYFVQIPSVQFSVPASTSIAGLAGMTDDVAAGAERSGRSVVALPAVDIDAATRRVLSRFPVPPAAADGRMSAYPMLFYPGAAVLTGATSITIGYAEVRSADFRLDAVPAVRVTGRVDGPADAVAGIPVRLFAIGTESLGHGGEAASTIATADGSFSFTNVPAGEYVLDARRAETGFTVTPLMRSTALPATPGAGLDGQTMYFIGAGPSGTYIDARTSSGSQSWTGQTRVSVGSASVANTAVVLRRAARLTGRVDYEMATPADLPTGPAGLLIRAEPANGSAMLGMPRAAVENRAMSGPFALDGLQAGEYFLRPQLPGGWTVKTIVCEGRDYTNVPFDASNGQDFANVVLTLTNATVVLTGSVTTGQGQPAADAAVIVFPVEREQRSKYGLTPTRIRATRVTTSGTFRINVLPAGSYLAIAVEAARIQAWQDPVFLEKTAALATRVTLTWGGQTNQDLRQVTVR